MIGPAKKACLFMRANKQTNQSGDLRKEDKVKRNPFSVDIWRTDFSEVRSGITAAFPQF